MRQRAAVVAVFASFLACETPRDRACRALALQTTNAEAARTAVTPDPRMAAYRAHSAARWLRSNAVDDGAIKADVQALASALDRSADARLKLADAGDTLGATDAADLVARADRVLQYEGEVEKVRPSHGECATAGPGITLAAHAERCAKASMSPAIRSAADWAKTLPPRDLEETLARARTVSLAIAERGRADADITRLVSDVKAKCGS